MWLSGRDYMRLVKRVVTLEERIGGVQALRDNLGEKHERLLTHLGIVEVEEPMTPAKKVFITTAENKKRENKKAREYKNNRKCVSQGVEAYPIYSDRSPCASW